MLKIVFLYEHHPFSTLESAGKAGRRKDERMKMEVSSSRPTQQKTDLSKHPRKRTPPDLGEKLPYSVHRIVQNFYHNMQHIYKRYILSVQQTS